MGICCGPFDLFFCLGGQYYGSGHPNGETLNAGDIFPGTIHMKLKCFLNLYDMIYILLLNSKMPLLSRKGLSMDEINEL